MSHVENCMSSTEQTKPEDKSSINKNSEVKTPVKTKINKKERKKRMNARIRRLVSPKSPLMVFFELFKDVPIKLQEFQRNNILHYTATIEIDGQVFTGNQISKTQAKHQACENYFRAMLAKKICNQFEKKEETSMNMEIKDGKNDTVSKPKGPPQEDFPWPHFASLAMYNLINQWNLQNLSKDINLQEEKIINVIKSEPKVKIGAVKQFPKNPKNINPVQLLYQMKPGLQFIVTCIRLHTPSRFQVKCKIDGVPFLGQGSSKKEATRECCIAAIKFFWHFDFHAVEND